MLTLLCGWVILSIVLTPLIGLFIRGVPVPKRPHLSGQMLRRNASSTPHSPSSCAAKQDAPQEESRVYAIRG